MAESCVISMACHALLGDTLSHAVDEACHHEDRVQVPLLLQVPPLCPPPGEGEPFSVLPSKLNDPVEGQGDHSMEEDLGCYGDKTKAAASSS